MKLKNLKNWCLVIVSSSLVACSSAIRFSSFNETANQSFKVGKEKNLTTDKLKILNEVEKWIGTPYCYGGDSRGCVDCSGFVYNVFASLGYSLPRTSVEQSKVGFIIEPENLDVGDLLFFGKGNKITHVAIYLGNGEIAHSTRSKGVYRERLKPSQINELVVARRILK